MVSVQNDLLLKCFKRTRVYKVTSAFQILHTGVLTVLRSFGTVSVVYCAEII